jgi:hypothetical protein
MRPSEVSKSLVALLPANRPVYVWWPPGCGKSSVVMQQTPTSCHFATTSVRNCISTWATFGS